MFKPWWEKYLETQNNTTFNYHSEYNDGETHYTVNSDGKTTTVKDCNTGIEGVSKCNPEDKFDLQKGIDLALERMKKAVEQKKLEEVNNKIEDGCYAVVVDNGGVYPTCSEYCKSYFTLDECIRFGYNYLPVNGTKVFVKRIVNNKAIIEYIPKEREDVYSSYKVVSVIKPDCLKRVNS